ncbi:Lrp/AsnC family transcriptional regulator [Acinetobacter sp.]|jgi:DNA-binding Lrp family transcriptional regulator|uniref:Lrp/AsnC family transcriptional regulator n=1 Tax=Acinetobacter sp. TaxID=472 RepID=UPI00282B7BB0|nr:Lrp/AsnC family transcriptional regulator [Acinetobacter sp.]MDR2250256.1 Lrp/AsnC family transcriptional regulator [Acinetobacter sp.]
MNDTDRQILSLLRENARMSVTELAQKVRVSRATIQKRIEALEASGIITGYTVRIKPGFEQNMIRAWMSIVVEGNRMQNIIKVLRGEPVVNTLHTTNGKWDLLVELKAESLEQFDRALGRIRQIDGISYTETSILLSTYKA